MPRLPQVYGSVKASLGAASYLFFVSEGKLRFGFLRRVEYWKK
jgi:hypothetical protein